MDAVALHEQRQAIVAQTSVRYAVVAYQGIGGDQYLSCITGIGETLRIARHSGVEHHLASRIGLIAERPAAELTAIIKN